MERFRLGRYGTFAASLAMSLCGCGAAMAASAGGDCTALRDLKIDDTNLLSSVVVPAKDALPEYCRVLGYVRPAINFEIRLPTKDWNGKFYMVGCGGSCGKLATDYFSSDSTFGINHGLHRNYAVSTTDSGHWGRSLADTRWADHNPVGRFDYEERAVTETARVTKAMIAVFYGSAPKRSYFAGCSNAGRQGHMEAWKYPDDFDAVISGAPALQFTRLDVLWAWETKANTGLDGKNALGFGKVPMLAEAVYKACAHVGGLIDDPRACRFEPKTLQCQATDGPDCLTSAEVAKRTAAKSSFGTAWRMKRYLPRARKIGTKVSLDRVDIRDSGSTGNLIQAPFLGASDVFGSANVEGPPVGADAGAFAG